MYKINEVKLKNEEGKTVTAYGIEGERHSFKALSCNKERIEDFCRLCNELELDEEHLIYAVEDLI